METCMTQTSLRETWFLSLSSGWQLSLDLMLMGSHVAAPLADTGQLELFHTLSTPVCVSKFDFSKWDGLPFSLPKWSLEGGDVVLNWETMDEIMECGQFKWKLLSSIICMWYLLQLLGLRIKPRCVTVTKLLSSTFMRFCQFTMLYKVVLGWKSSHETLVCEYSNESYLSCPCFKTLHKILVPNHLNESY